MSFTLFTEFFKKIDLATATFVTQMSSNCIATITPIVSVLLALMFIAFGILIMKGMVEMPLMEFLGKSLRIGIITSIALSSGFYQQKIGEVLKTLPDDLAQSLVSDKSAKNGATGIIDNACLHTYRLASSAFKQAVALKVSSIAFALIGLFITVIGALLSGIGVALLVVIKVSMAVLTGLGPFFIITLLWKPTERLFEMWSAQLMNYTILMVIFTSVFGFVMSAYGNFMADIKFDGWVNIAYCVGSSASLAVAIMVLMFQLPNLASSIAGGIALSFRREAHSAGNVANNTGKMIAGGAKLAGQGAVAAGRLMTNGAQAAFNYVKGRARG